MTRTTFFFLVVISLASGCVRPVADESSRIEYIENNLLPSSVPAGVAMEPQSLEQRMTLHQVPGVSIAYFADGKILWTRTYGFRDSTRTLPVDTATLFQAASISKPVAASAALRLVEQGKLALDTPVNQYLRSWQVPDNRFTVDKPVTLRGLVTHSAGLTVHGFGGYAATDAVPSTLGVLNGQAPANSPPIVVDTFPGALWRYSGGGYTVMQQLLEDVSRQPFAELMAQQVLGPASMVHSTYQQPLPAAFQSNNAHGFTPAGKAIPGAWHTYPEQAAAGLWTTPTDLARWALAVQRAYQGKSQELLSKAMAGQMLTPHLNDWGLGPGLTGSGDTLTFGHGGSNEGFRCQLIAFARPGGPGVAIMTNGDNGSRLIKELLISIDEAYGWNHFHRDSISTITLSTNQIDRMAGCYGNPPFVIQVGRDGEQLVARQTWDGATFSFLPTDTLSFFSFEEQLTVRFVANDQGRITQMIANGRLEMPRRVCPEGE